MYDTRAGQNRIGDSHNAHARPRRRRPGRAGRSPLPHPAAVGRRRHHHALRRLAVVNAPPTHDGIKLLARASRAARRWWAAGSTSARSGTSFDISMGNSDYGPSRRLEGWMLARRDWAERLYRDRTFGRAMARRWQELRAAGSAPIRPPAARTARRSGSCAPGWCGGSLGSTASSRAHARCSGCELRCPPLRSMGRLTGQGRPSNHGEWDRPASWGAGRIPLRAPAVTSFRRRSAAARSHRPRGRRPAHRP